MTSSVATVPDAATCLGCGYALRGLPGLRCPECGRPFDPADPMTMGPHGVLPPWPLQLWIRQCGSPTVLWAAVTLLSAVAMTVLGESLGGGGVAPLAPVASLWLGDRAREPLRARQLRRFPTLAPPRRVRPRRRRQLWAGLLACAVVASVRSSSCVHGTRVTLLGVGVAHSVTGGPCRNDMMVPFRTATHLFGDWYGLI